MFGLSNTAALGIGVAVVASVLLWLVYKGASTSNATADRTLALRTKLAKHNMTIRVCVRAQGPNAATIAQAIHESVFSTATSPARLRVAVVADGVNDDVFTRYIEYAQSNGVHARRLRTFNLLPEQSQGWMQAWNLWHRQLSEGESGVVVIDLHRFALKPGWDVHVERLIDTLAHNMVFTASGPIHFPCLEKGIADHRFFPAIVPQEFAMRKGPLTPCIAADPGLMVFGGRGDGPVSVRLRGRCSRAETGVATSGELYDSGMRFVSACCNEWLADQGVWLSRAAPDFEDGGVDGVETEFTAPEAATEMQYHRATTLSPQYEEFTGLESTAQDPGVREAVLYDVPIRTRMGLTPNFNVTQERLRKYGPQGSYQQTKTYLYRLL